MISVAKYYNVELPSLILMEQYQQEVTDKSTENISTEEKLRTNDWTKPTRNGFNTVYKLIFFG